MDHMDMVMDHMDMVMDHMDMVMDMVFYAMACKQNEHAASRVIETVGCKLVY